MKWFRRWWKRLTVRFSKVPKGPNKRPYRKRDVEFEMQVSRVLKRFKELEKRHRCCNPAFIVRWYPEVHLKVRKED